MNKNIKNIPKKSSSRRLHCHVMSHRCMVEVRVWCGVMSRSRVVVVVVEVRVCVVRRKCCIVVRPRWLPGVVVVARHGDVATCSPLWSSFLNLKRTVTYLFSKRKSNSIK